MNETNRKQPDIGELPQPQLYHFYTLYDGFELTVGHDVFKAWLIDYTTISPDPMQHGKYRLTLLQARNEIDHLKSVKLWALDQAGHSPAKREQYIQEIKEELRPGQPIQHFYIDAISDPLSAKLLLRSVIDIKIVLLTDKRMNVYIHHDQNVPVVVNYAEELVQVMKRQWDWQPIPEVEQQLAKDRQLQDRLLSEIVADSTRGQANLSRRTHMHPSLSRVKMQEPPGRRRYPEDEWARTQVHYLNRSRGEVYPEWLQKDGVRVRLLANPKDTFSHMIKSPPKKKPEELE